MLLVPPTDVRRAEPYVQRGGHAVLDAEASEMSVPIEVNKAGGDYQSTRVDCDGAAQRVAGDFTDLAALDANVPYCVCLRLRVDDPTVADDEVIGSAGRFLPVAAMKRYGYRGKKEREKRCTSHGVSTGDGLYSQLCGAATVQVRQNAVLFRKRRMSGYIAAQIATVRQGGLIAATASTCPFGKAA